MRWQRRTNGRKWSLERHVDRLQGNVVGSGVEMSLDAPGDDVKISPCSDHVDEPVAPSLGEVGLVEAELTEAVGVVLDREQPPDIPSGDGAGASRVRLENHSLLGSQEPVGSKRRTRPARVLDGCQKCVGSR